MLGHTDRIHRPTSHPTATEQPTTPLQYVPATRQHHIVPLPMPPLTATLAQAIATVQQDGLMYQDMDGDGSQQVATGSINRQGTIIFKATESTTGTPTLVMLLKYQTPLQHSFPLNPVSLPLQ